MLTVAIISLQPLFLFVIDALEVVLIIAALCTPYRTSASANCTECINRIT